MGAHLALLEEREHVGVARLDQVVDEQPHLGHQVDVLPEVGVVRDLRERPTPKEDCAR